MSTPPHPCHPAVVALVLGTVTAGLAGCGSVPVATSPRGSQFPAGSPAGATPAGTAGASATAASGSHAACPPLLRLSTGPHPQLALVTSSGGVTTVATPVGLTWVGANGRGELAAADGSAHVLLAAGAAATTSWRTLVPRVTSGPPIAYPLWNGAWSPDGRHLALTAASADAGGSSQLVILDAEAGSASVLDVAGGADPVPPAWLDASRLLVAHFDQRGARSWLLVTASAGRVAVAGSLDAVRGGMRVLATSGDGAFAAATVGGKPSIRTGQAEAWLLQGVAPSGMLAVPDGATVEALALDRSGSCLAASVLLADGSSAVVVAHRAAAGWQVVAQHQAPADAAGALVAWLP